MFSSSTTSNDDHIIAEPPNDAVSRLRFSNGSQIIFEYFQISTENSIYTQNSTPDKREKVLTLEKPKWTIYLLGLMGK